LKKLKNKKQEMNKNTKSKVYNHTLFSSSSVQPTNDNNDPNVPDTSTNIGTPTTTTSNVSSIGSNEPTTPIQQQTPNIKLMGEQIRQRLQQQRKEEKEEKGGGGLMDTIAKQERITSGQSSPVSSKKKVRFTKNKPSSKLKTIHRMQSQFKKIRKPVPINQVRPINKKIMDFIGMVGSYTGITHIEKYLNTVDPALYEESEEEDEEEEWEEESEEEEYEEQQNLSNINVFEASPVGKQTPTKPKPFTSLSPPPTPLFQSPSLKPLSTAATTLPSSSSRLITPSKISISNIFSEINRLEDASFQIHSHALTAYTLLNNRFPYLLNGAPDYHIFIYYGNNMVLSLFANLVASMMHKTKFIVPTTISFDKNYMRINTAATLFVQRLGEYRFDADINTFIHFNEKNDEITSYTSFTGGSDGSQQQQRSIFANGNNATMYPSFMLNRQNSMF
jgi:hypothetical protein